MYLKFLMNLKKHVTSHCFFRKKLTAKNNKIGANIIILNTVGILRINK